MAEPTALFIGRVPSAADADELRRVFSKYGEVVRCDVKRGTNLSYGFVEYGSPDHAAEALRECNGMTLLDEQIVVEFARAAARKREDNNCFSCGEVGHWARDCPSGPRRGGGPGPHRSRSPPRSYRRDDRRDDYRRDDRRDDYRRDDRRDENRRDDRRTDYRRDDRRDDFRRDDRRDDYRRDDRRDDRGYDNHHHRRRLSPEPRADSRRRRSPDRAQRRHSRSRSQSPRGGHRNSGAQRDTGSSRRQDWEGKSADSAIGEPGHRAVAANTDNGW